MAWRDRLRRRPLEDSPPQQTTWETPVRGSSPDWPFDDPTLSPEFLAGYRSGYDAGPPAEEPPEVEHTDPETPEPGAAVEPPEALPADPPRPDPEPREQEVADQDAPTEAADPETAPQTGPDPALGSGDAVPEGDRTRRRMLVALLAVLVLGAVALLWPRDALAPRSAPADRVTPAPVPLEPQEAFVRSRLDADAVSVEQWISQPGELLTLSLPPAVLLPDDVTPTVTALAVRADGVEVEGPATLRRGTASWELPPATEQVQVTYVVDGSVRRSSTKADRALVWLLALRTDAPPTDTIHRIEGVEVRALACQAPGDVVPRTCGEPDGSGWTVRSTREERDVLVTAQVDLADGP